jgi:TolA-binding protein
MKAATLITLYAAAVVSIVALVLSCSVAFAQAPPKPADPPKAEKIAVPLEARDNLRAAIHKQDQIEKQISDLNSQFLQVQSRAQQQSQSLQSQEKAAADAVEAAKVEAYKAAKLDRAKWEIDIEGMEFSAKPEQKAEAKK